MNTIINKIMTSKLLLKSIIITALICSCKPQLQEKQEESNMNNKTQNVEVVNPVLDKFTADTLITGTTAPNQRVVLSAMESGFVREVRKDIGDKVNKGEIIAILDNPELYRQKQKLKAELKARKSTYERLRDIHKKTPALTSIQQVEYAEAIYLGTKAELDAIEDHINFKSQGSF